MRRFLTISFIALALAAGAIGVASVVHAQTAAGTTIPTTFSSADTNSGYNIIMIKIMELFAWLVGVAAVTLNYAVYYTVVTMGAYVKNLTAIGVTWRILRDISNIALIFGFLAIGISIILNSEKFGWGSKMLPMLLVAAVFLNFSLFISEAVVDAGNLFATEFYTQINGGTLPTTAPNSGLLTTASGKTLTTSNEGISNAIMNQLGLQTIYGNGTVNTAIFQAGNPWLIGFMGILLFLVTAFVMFSLAFILIARFIVLIFLIIVAPIGFAGLAIPQLKNIASQWWSALFGQTITAPILLLMLYIALAVITDAHFIAGFGMTTITGGAATGFVNNLNLPGFASFMLSFIVAMGLLLMVVILSKKLGAFGAGWATKTAGKLSFGATAFAMRSTVGSGSQYLSKKVRTSRIGSTKTGRLLAGTFDRGAKASFDVRGTKTFGNIPFGGVNAGEAQKGGYRARQEKSVSGHEEYIKSVTKAIDERGATKAESARVEEEKKKALEAHEAAKNEHKTVEQQAKQQKEEVAQLEAEKAREIKFSPSGTASLETEQKLSTARQNLATSEEKLATASTNLTQAVTQLTAAQKQTAEDVAKGRITTEKKNAQLTYAENIRRSIPGWAAFGPGGPTAAKRIIREANKTKTGAEKILEIVKTTMKEEAEEEAKKTASGNAAGAATTAPVAEGAAKPASAPISP